MQTSASQVVLRNQVEARGRPEGGGAEGGVLQLREKMHKPASQVVPESNSKQEEASGEAPMGVPRGRAESTFGQHG